MTNKTDTDTSWKDELVEIFSAYACSFNDQLYTNADIPVKDARYLAECYIKELPNLQEKISTLLANYNQDLTEKIKGMRVGIKPPYESEDGYQKRARGYNQACNDVIKVLEEAK